MAVGCRPCLAGVQSAPPPINCRPSLNVLRQGRDRFIAMRLLKVFCVGVLLALPGGTAALAAPPEILLRERCHQGECTFTKITQTKTVGKNADGYMLEVKERSAVVT